MTDMQALSIFTILTDRLGKRLQPIQATKATLVDVSHILEDLVLHERLPALIFTGFQESSHWRAETERYRELAGVAHQICIFAGGQLPPESDQKQIHVRLHGPDPLRQEWFLLVLTERFAAVLCGRDLQAPALSEGDRRFDTIWTFEPDLITEIIAVLHEVVARERPDRLTDLETAIERFPPPPPDAHLLTLFTTRMIDDLVRQHEARLQLESMLAYESRLRALGQVLSGVAHELNNPLQGILGFAGLIAEDPAQNASTLEEAGYIVEAAQRAQTIVQSLLQLSRPNSSEPTLVSLNEIIDQTMIFVRADMSSYGINLSITSEPEVVPVLVNRVRIQQLLINLLTNGIQALAGQTGPRQMEIIVRQHTPEWVDLRIHDNGPGIPAELHERVFEPFFTTKAPGEGTGLGLSIVQTIVEEHQGHLKLESGPLRGTTFSILLPTGVKRKAETEPVQAEDSGADLILVIDDDPQIGLLLERVLKRAGYAVRTERNPEVGLRRVLHEPFGVIISDLLMPEMPGTEFYERLIRLNPTLGRRMLFITGDATRPATQAFLQGTGQPYLLKPFTTQQLLSSVAQLVAAQPPLVVAHGSAIVEPAPARAPEANESS